MDEYAHELDYDFSITMEKFSLTDLSHDLFLLVIGKLVDVSDFVRIRATYKRRRHLVSLSDSPHLPWIFNRQLISLGVNIEFYSLTSGEFRTIHVPEASDKFLAGLHKAICWPLMPGPSLSPSLTHSHAMKSLCHLELKLGALTSFF
jgi:hypothetical protein